jgi:hypothetical protein
MKRIVLIGLVLIVGAFVVDWIGDATQTRRDERDTSRATQVVIDVQSRHYKQSLDTAAMALYASCSATVPGRLVQPGIEAVGTGKYRFAVAPSLGEHGKERLLGCLNDLSIDRVKSHVDSVQDVPREATVG